MSTSREDGPRTVLEELVRVVEADAASQQNARYPSEDGPGARTEITVRVIRGTERATVIVNCPGSPSTRIVASRERLALAAGQRVAELVEEALAQGGRG